METEFDSEELQRLVNETTVERDGTDVPLGAIIESIEDSHEKLDKYKAGALSLSQALDERKMIATQEGNEQLVRLLDEVKQSAFGVYLRLQRGDLEMMGKREGKHSGYLVGEQGYTEE